MVSCDLLCGVSLSLMAEYSFIKWFGEDPDASFILAAEACRHETHAVTHPVTGIIRDAGALLGAVLGWLCVDACHNVVHHGDSSGSSNGGMGSILGASVWLRLAGATSGVVVHSSAERVLPDVSMEVVGPILGLQWARWIAIYLQFALATFACVCGAFGGEQSDTRARAKQL